MNNFAMSRTMSLIQEPKIDRAVIDEISAHQLARRGRASLQ